MALDGETSAVVSLRGDQSRPIEATLAAFSGVLKAMA